MRRKASPYCPYFTVKRKQSVVPIFHVALVAVPLESIRDSGEGT